MNRTMWSHVSRIPDEMLLGEFGGRVGYALRFLKGGGCLSGYVEGREMWKEEPHARRGRTEAPGGSGSWKEVDGEMAGGRSHLLMEHLPPCHRVLDCKSLLLPLLEGHPKEETWCPV